MYLCIVASVNSLWFQYALTKVDVYMLLILSKFLGLYQLLNQLHVEDKM
jgi:hypothetical protein